MDKLNRKYDQIIQEDLQQIGSELDEKPTNPLLKKIFIFTAMLVMTILVLSLVFVTYPIGDILSSKLESQQLNNKMIELPQLSIIFEENTLDTLRTFYFQQQKVEWSACLQGYEEKSNYHITQIYQPQMFQQSFNHVSFEPCLDSLIILHTHPYKSCLASSTDLDTLKETQKVNPRTLMVVMCEPERFSVYN